MSTVTRLRDLDRRTAAEKLLAAVDALRAGVRELLLVWAVIASTVAVAAILAQHAPEAAKGSVLPMLLNGVAGALFVWLCLGLAVELGEQYLERTGGGDVDA